MARNQISSIAFGQVNSAVRILPGASVTVTSASGAPVTLYASEDGAETVSNPFTCDEQGRYAFFVTAGEDSYTITVILGPVSYSWEFYPPDNTAAAGLIYEDTWVNLVGRSANLDGAAAEVTEDAGTHLDATATGYDGGEVANLGRYRWNAAWGRWERLPDLTPALYGQPYESQTALEAANIPATITSVRVIADGTVLDYARSNDPADIQSSDGQWWARAPSTDKGMPIPFASRAEAQASVLPSVVTTMKVASPTGDILRYVRDNTGTALTTADGANWSPDGTAHPDHWGENAAPGTTDMSPAINAAISYVTAKGGGVVQLSEKRYSVGSSINLEDGVVLAGSSFEATEIAATGDFPAIQYVGSLANQLARATIRDMIIRGGGMANTSAHGVALSWANKAQIYNVQFRSCRYCITAEYCIDLTLDHVFCEGQSTDQNYGGLFLAGIDQTTYGTVDNTQIISNCSFRQVAFAGVRAEGTTGLKASNVACLNGDYGWYFGDPALGADARILRFLHLTNCFADTNVFAGFKFSQGTSPLPIRDVKMVNGWAGSVSDATGKAIDIDGMQYSTFDGGVFTYARSNLIRVQNSDHLVFSGNELYQHDWGNTGDDCVLIQNSELITISNATAQPQTGGAGTAGVRFEGCTECAVTGGAFDDVVGVELHDSSRCSISGVTVRGTNPLAIESGTSNFNTITGNASAVAPTIIGANSFEAGNAGTTNPRVRLVGGSAGAPAFYLSTSANSGFYRSGTHGFAYSANGVRRFEITDARMLIDPSILGDYADDTAAASGGVAVGQAYRTGSTVKLRIS